MIADAVILKLPKVSLQAKELLPEHSGIYYVLDETHKIWYIGQAKNIRKRWQGKTHHRIYQLEAQKKKHFTIYYEQVSVSQLDSIEKQRIEKYHPHLNASPVKTKKIRPTETLLRETLVAIAPFAFILGVEPPRKEIESQIRLEWLAKKKVLDLNVSARKYIVPAKVNIKLEDIGYSAWIPFGLNKEFPTFEDATEEIRRRLKNSDLPRLKIAFKRETIAK